MFLEFYRNSFCSHILKEALLEFKTELCWDVLFFSASFWLSFAFLLKELSALICLIMLSCFPFSCGNLLYLRCFSFGLILPFSSLLACSLRTPSVATPNVIDSSVFWLLAAKLVLDSPVERVAVWVGFGSITANSSTLLSDSLTAMRYLDGSCVSRSTYFGIVSLFNIWFHSVRPMSWRTLTGSW